MRAYVIALPLIVFVLISQKSIAVLLLASLLVYYFFTKRLVWQKTFFSIVSSDDSFHRLVLSRSDSWCVAIDDKWF